MVFPDLTSDLSNADLDRQSLASSEESISTYCGSDVLCKAETKGTTDSNNESP